MGHRRAAVLAACTLALPLAGCVSIGGGKAPDSYFALGPQVAVPPGRGAEATPAQALVVAEPEVDRSLAITGIAARDGKGAIAYFPKAVWVDRPARLFLDLLADTIRASDNRVVIAEDAETPAGAQRLSGRLTSFAYDETSRSAIVRYDALLRAPDGHLSQRRFEAVEKVSSPKAEKVADALGRAAAKVAADVADWVK